MATRRTTRARSGYIFLPFRTDQVWKITVTDNSGVTLDITSLISKCVVEDFVTESIGKFEFEIFDPNEVYASLWTGNEVFKYYKDFGTVASTLRFTGKVEKISKRYHKVVVSGRSESLKFLTTRVTASFSNQLTSSILTTLVSDYASGFTSNNVTVSTVSVSVNWVEKPFWECVQQLCEASGFECYVDANLDFNYFLSGSRLNDDEAVAHDFNMLDIDDFTPDLTLVRNRITVYGGTVDGVQLIYTAEDLTSQGLYGVKEELLKDDNITSYSQIVDVAEFELANKKDPPITGSVKSFLLVGVKPGDSVRIQDEADRLVDDYYVSTGYTDTIDYLGGEYTTEVHLAKETRKVSHVIKDRIVNENKRQDTGSNPYGLKNSYVFTFDDDNGTHNSTAIANGTLYPTASSGTWVSPSRIVSGVVGPVYLLLNATQVNNIAVSVSGDGGVTYQSIAGNEYLVLSSASGSNLVIKVVFNDQAASVNSLSLMYSYS